MKVTGNPDDVDAFIIDTYEIIKQTNIRLKTARDYSGEIIIQPTSEKDGEE